MQRQRFSNAKSGLKIQVVIGLLVLGAVTVASAAAANAGRAPGEGPLIDPGHVTRLDAATLQVYLVT